MLLVVYDEFNSRAMQRNYVLVTYFLTSNELTHLANETMIQHFCLHQTAYMQPGYVSETHTVNGSKVNGGTSVVFSLLGAKCHEFGTKMISNILTL